MAQSQKRIFNNTHSRLPAKFLLAHHAAPQSDYGNILGLQPSPQTRHTLDPVKKKLPHLHNRGSSTARKLPGGVEEKKRKSSNPDRADLLRLIQK